MGIPDHLTSLLRNLYAGQEATVRTRHGTTYLVVVGTTYLVVFGTTHGSKLGKEYIKAIYCHHAYLIYMLDWMKHS